MKEIRKRVQEWIAVHRGSLAEEICELVRIRSVADKTASVGPYGQGCRDAVDKYMEICHRHGLEVENHGYQVAEAYHSGWGDRRERIGLMGHLDVVPEGSGWNWPPYEGIIKDGWILGRGAQDNKGPCLAALYTLLCLRDLGVELKHDIRALAGTNEENGMEDADYYASCCQTPDFTLVVDSPFPICYGERGILEAWMIADDAFSGQVLDFYGGQVSSQVPGEATLKLADWEETRKKLEEREGMKEGCGWETQDGAIVLRAVGKGGHVAFPEKTENAILVLLNFVLERGLLCEESDRRILEAVYRMALRTDGSGAGIACQDDVSGSLVCGCGIVKVEDHKVWFNLNARCPVTADGEALLERMRVCAKESGFRLGNTRLLRANYYPKEEPVIQALDQTFRKVTGLDWKPQIFHAGTHARRMPNAVAYGPGCLDGTVCPPSPWPAGHGGAHQPNEAQSIDCLCLAIEIYVLAILEIDGLDLKEKESR